MKYLIKIVAIAGVLAIAVGRPPITNERNESEEEEYEGDDESAIDDSLDDSDQPRVNSQDGLDADQEGSRSQMSFDEKVFIQSSTDRTANTENFSEYEANKNNEDKPDHAIQSNDDFQSFPSRHQPNAYVENNESRGQPDASQQLSDRFINGYQSNRITNGMKRNDLRKRTIFHQASGREEHEPLYENRDGPQQLSNHEKNDYNNQAVDAAEPGYFQQYYNAIQANKAKLNERNSEITHFNINRDRRQAKTAIEKDADYSHVSNRETVDDSINEDEESAIKRHVKKLSEKELEELLNSLSDDKKALLNKIMDGNRNTLEGMSKREITKKAGAVGVNNFMENGISDKGEGASQCADVSSDPVASHNVDTTESTKQLENQTLNVGGLKDASEADSMNTKVQLIISNDDLSLRKSDLSSENLADINIKDQESVQPLSKIEIKRETNLNDLANLEKTLDAAKLKNSKISNGYFIGQQELAQLIDNEINLGSNADHAYKREAYLDNQMDLNEPFKSLEESFPNSEVCEESGQYSEADMVPLVRVKRKNEEVVMKKRAAAILPDAKVAYVPYRAENDDEDTEEGGEFEDDGFYDPSSMIIENKAADEMIGHDTSSNKFVAKSKFANVDHPDFPRREKMATDSIALGSDTDSVLSGVEGVDDNLMYSSGSRNRRATEDKMLTLADVPALKTDLSNRPLRSAPLTDDEIKSDTESINAPNYQEHDAFGPIPRSYEDLGRFKRIRCVKSSARDASSSNT